MTYEAIGTLTLVAIVGILVLSVFIVKGLIKDKPCSKVRFGIYYIITAFLLYMGYCALMLAMFPELA